MLRKIDRSASALLAIFALGHAVPGTLMIGPLMDPSTMWAFSGSVAAWAIAALNWLRSSRPDDRALAAWALAGAITWIALMLWLMEAASMWADPRPSLFNAVCTILAAFSLAGVLGRPLYGVRGA